MTAHAATIASDDRVQLGSIGPRMFRLGLIGGAVGLGGAALMAATGLFGGSWEGFFRSYLVAFMFCLSIGLGGYFFTIIQHATRAGWAVVLRRFAEGIFTLLPFVAILFLPLAILVVSGKGGALYEWSAPDALDDPVIAHKAPYLNVGFWLVRAVVFFGIWTALGLFFWRNSTAQDASGDVALTHRMQRIAPVAALLFALTVTYSAVDWMMSLAPHWFSTIFGVYFFAISCCSFFSVLILLVFWLQRSGRLVNEITTEHWQDMGKLLFAFGVCFHAYIGFSQFMLIWYANVPEETGWIITRITGSWKWLWAGLFLCHFGVPFVVLATKHTKRRPVILAGIAAWMLLMSYFDLYLLIMPHVDNHAIAEAASFNAFAEGVRSGAVDTGFHPSLMDLGCLVGLGGLMKAALARRLGSAALIPLRDPRLRESMAFENM